MLGRAFEPCKPLLNPAGAYMHTSATVIAALRALAINPKAWVAPVLIIALNLTGPATNIMHGVSTVSTHWHALIRIKYK